jgi:lipoyl-dependent peroxiredoxin
MGMERKAQASWQGDLPSGQGLLSTESGLLKEANYSFSTRFKNGVGTNPEELIAAAHAGCFTMAVVHELSFLNVKPAEIETEAIVHFENLESSWTVTRIHLMTHGRVPGITADNFQAAVEEAKKNCPISRLLNAEITVDAVLDLPFDNSSVIEERKRLKFFESFS